MTTLGKSTSATQDLPFAMFFATEPSYPGFSSEKLRAELDYNPVLQMNNGTIQNVPHFGQTSTSVRSSTSTGALSTDTDSDSKGDESS